MLNVTSSKYVYISKFITGIRNNKKEANKSSNLIENSVKLYIVIPIS